MCFMVFIVFSDQKRDNTGHDGKEGAHRHPIDDRKYIYIDTYSSLMIYTFILPIPYLCRYSQNHLIHQCFPS